MVEAFASDSQGEIAQINFLFYKKRNEKLALMAIPSTTLYSMPRYSPIKTFLSQGQLWRSS